MFDIDEEYKQAIRDFLKDNDDVKSYLNQGEINKAIITAYNNLDNDDEFLYFYYMLLKKGITENLLAPDRSFSVNIDGDKLKVTVDFDELKSLYSYFDDFARKARDMIDFNTCIDLISDPFEATSTWNYDDASLYDEAYDRVEDGSIALDSDNEHLWSLCSEEDLRIVSARAAAQAARDSAVNDAEEKAINALKDSLKKLYSYIEFGTESITMMIPIKNILAQFNEVEDWKENLAYTIIEGSPIPTIVGYVLATEYEFFEPYSGFDTTITDKAFNNYLSDEFADMDI